MGPAHGHRLCGSVLLSGCGEFTTLPRGSEDAGPLALAAEMWAEEPHVAGRQVHCQSGQDPRVLFLWETEVQMMGPRTPGPRQALPGDIGQVTSCLPWPVPDGKWVSAG